MSDLVERLKASTSYDDRSDAADLIETQATRIAELEAALATARRNALEEAEQIALQHPESDRGGYSGIMRTAELCTAMEIAATIRAALEGGKKDE